MSRSGLARPIPGRIRHAADSTMVTDARLVTFVPRRNKRQARSHLALIQGSNPTNL